MCYRFVEKWLPKVLEANEWDCLDAIELSLWWRALDECQIPIEAIGPGNHRPLDILFRYVKDIRHFAVHRLTNIPINTIQQMITDSLDMAKIFRDDSYIPKFNLWREKLSYFLELVRAARGNLDTARKLDSINTLKEENKSGQDKLHQEIKDLQKEIDAKKQQINALQGEYRDHCKNEIEITNRVRGEPHIQEARQCSRSLGNLKWLEECFTLHLDRDAPNIMVEHNLSGRLIKLSTIGREPIPARSNVGVGPNIDGGGGINLFIENGNFMPGQQNPQVNLDIALRPGFNGIPGIPGIPTLSSNPGINGLPGIPGIPSLNSIPGLGRRAFSGPVLPSHGRQVIPSTAIIIDLTGDDDDAGVMVQ